MASLTVRQLDERLKNCCVCGRRKSGRSVEDEVRTILREAAEETGYQALDLINPSSPPKRGARTSRTSRMRDDEVPGAKRVLLIIGGGIAAYKSLDLIRRLKERGIAVRCILTKAAENFVTPLSASALVGERVFTDLFDPASEFDVSHIRLARETDLIVDAPATADLMAKISGGHADDLATTVLLATTEKILLAPAMNSRMWANKTTQRNLAQLMADGIAVVGPNEGEMAEAHERGLGRMAEPLEIAAAVEKMLSAGTAQALKGKRVLITSKPSATNPIRALHRQSLVRQAGPRHCRRGGRRRG